MSSPPKQPLLPPSEQTRTKHPHNNDVLCGRGGTINAHPGNEQYRTFVDRKKRVYLTARFKREKRLIAQSIVDEIRRLDPPGRFLIKESNGDYWHDVGDEKARDKTSQALRENSMSVRRQMEEEFNETRRQQAREVAIAAGRDPDKAVEELSGKPKAAEPADSTSGGLQPPAERGGLQPKIAGLKPPGPQSGFIGRSGYGPLYDAQQPTPSKETRPLNQQPPLQQAETTYPPQPQYAYCHTAHHPASYEQHASHHHYPPQPGYYAQAPQPQHLGHATHPYQYSQPRPHQQYSYAIPQHQMMPPPAYDPSMHSSAHYAHHGVPPGRTASPLIDSQHIMHAAHVQHPPHQMISMSSTNVDPHHPNAPHYPNALLRQQHDQAPAHNVQYAHPPSQPDSAFRRRSADSIDRHVQFQSNEDPVREDVHVAPQFPSLASDATDIPLVIGAKKRSPKRHPEPRNQAYHHNDQMISEAPHHYGALYASLDLSPLPVHTLKGQDDSDTVLSPRTMQSSMSQANMSQATPLTFMSNPFSVKTEDSLAKYLEVLEDEIAGDVGQEVELVAHAPMLDTNERVSEQETIVPRMQPRHHQGSISGRSACDSKTSGSYRGTPPRHKSSRRRRKHRSGHIPSNSGKVQFDLSSAAFEPNNVDNSSPPPAREGPCGNVAVSCGGMLPVHSPIVGRRQTQESVASPIYPLSPNSLDIDKMSLCEGASLMHVFDEASGANALMDMSVSLSSGPSSAASLVPNRGLGLQPIVRGQASHHGVCGEDHESLMGASALMDLSVGSASQSRSSISGNGSKHNSSESSTSSKRNMRSVSPASIDKNFIGNPELTGESLQQGASQAPGWTWDGKSKE